MADVLDVDTGEAVGKKEKVRKFPVMEVFGPTVQGEGLTIGQRTLFVRFGLCDYKCVMCDSMHAVDPKSVSENARWMEATDIVDEVTGLLVENNCNWVCLSGGNPAIHDLSTLVTILKLDKVGIAVETQGTKCPDWLLSCDYITVSPKGPGMGEIFDPEAFTAFMSKVYRHPGLSLKIVVFDARDFEFASMIAEMPIGQQLIDSDRFYLSVGNPNPPPLTGTVAKLNVRDGIARYLSLVEDVKEYSNLKSTRMLPQLHTFLWGNDKGR
jgi:7-carboxy-7-deazaguanine synthase